MLYFLLNRVLGLKFYLKQTSLNPSLLWVITTITIHTTITNLKSIATSWITHLSNITTKMSTLLSDVIQEGPLAPSSITFLWNFRIFTSCHNRPVAVKHCSHICADTLWLILTPDHHIKLVTECCSTLLKMERQQQQLMSG